MPLVLHQLVLDQFQIERLLGEGPTGYVYEAFDTLHQKHVAIKQLRSTFVRRATDFERVTAVANAAHALHLPQLVNLIQRAESDGVFLIVTIGAAIVHVLRGLI